MAAKKMQQPAPRKILHTTLLRAKLKRKMLEEIEKLPELLEQLEPDKRVDALIKILPFVLPKVEPVEMTTGEGWVTPNEDEVEVEEAV